MDKKNKYKIYDQVKGQVALVTGAFSGFGNIRLSNQEMVGMVSSSFFGIDRWSVFIDAKKYNMKQKPH